jgi:hypothetical protein
VQDAQGLIWRGHDQDQRSAARAPGMWQPSVKIDSD